MKNRNKKPDSVRHRQKIEELLKKKSLKPDSQFSEAETLKLIHELEVYQIELEMQSEELMRAKSVAQDAEKYIELYDLAPTGYVTLSKEGEIKEINLCAAQMLGKERQMLKKSSFGTFVSTDKKLIFDHFLEKVFNNNVKQSCEVTFSASSNLLINVYLTGIVIERGDQCLVTMIDITERKQAEKELEKWANIFKPKLN